MDRSGVLTLISITSALNEYGVMEETRTESDIYCQVYSVSQNEFFQGGQNGLKPKYKFVIYDAEYNNEPYVEYNGTVYAVYRTYLARNDKLELYVQEKSGAK